MKKNLYPKFIVEGDCLIMSAVTFHKELATNKTRVKGGGWYKQEENKITFYGRSYDFDEATPEDILSCIIARNIYMDKNKKIRLPEAYNFFYEKGEVLIELK